MAQEAAVATIQERHLTLEASITQRLKWGAGANPTLSNIMAQFEEALRKKNNTIQVDRYGPF